MPEEPTNAETTKEEVRLLGRSVWAVYCLLVVCVLLSLLSAMALAFQFFYRDEFGEPFRAQPGARLHLFGHLLRSVLGSLLAYFLWRYASAVSRLRSPERSDFRELFQSLGVWWKGLVFVALTMIVFGSWTAFGAKPAIATRALSPRFLADDSDDATVKVEFRLAELKSAESLIEARVVGTGETIFLYKKPLVTNRDIVEARVVLDEFDDEPSISVRFADAAVARIGAATDGHKGRPLAILIDGKVVAAPIVKWRIGESAMIRADFSKAEAERIARGLAGKE